MKLIEKDTLLAEIKERIKTYNKGYANGDDRRADALKVLLHDINNFEVKEVDFGTEVYKYMGEHFNVYDDENQTLQAKDKKSLIGRVDVENIAKHFFELGIKAAQKEDDNITKKEMVELNKKTR